MNILLEKLLRKRGIEDINSLDVEEKKDFDNWQKILSKDTLTAEDIRNFCQAQKDVIQGKWTDLSLDNSKKAEFIPYFTVYSLLLQVMDSPKKERESLENMLLNLINN